MPSDLKKGDHFWDAQRKKRVAQADGCLGVLTYAVTALGCTCDHCDPIHDARLYQSQLRMHHRLDWSRVEEMTRGMFVQSSRNERKAAVLLLLREGLTNQRIAIRLQLTVRSVERIKARLKQEGLL